MCERNRKQTKRLQTWDCKAGRLDKGGDPCNASLLPWYTSWQSAMKDVSVSLRLGYTCSIIEPCYKLSLSQRTSSCGSVPVDEKEDLWVSWNCSLDCLRGSSRWDRRDVWLLHLWGESLLRSGHEGVGLQVYSSIRNELYSCAICSLDFDWIMIVSYLFEGMGLRSQYQALKSSAVAIRNKYGSKTDAILRKEQNCSFTLNIC
jgi:hypothetical protein